MKYSADMAKNYACSINLNLIVLHFVYVAWLTLLKEQLCVEFFPPTLEVGVS